MPHFGSNEFTHFSIPLVFEGRYFILEPGDPALMSVLVDREGARHFEVLKNKAVDNEETEVTETPPGIITVSSKSTDQFIYKIRPGSETSVAFGTIDGKGISVKINDREIKVGNSTFSNNHFIGSMVGILIHLDGSMSVGAKISPVVLEWLSK